MRLLPSLKITGILAGALALPAGAATTFNWADPSVTVTVINSTTVQVTGTTTGDFLLPFTVNISTAGSTLDVTRNLLGGVTTPLNINHPAPRNVNTLTTVTIFLNGGILMLSPSYTLLDVDVSTGGGNTSNWEDRIVVFTAGSTLTPVNPAFTSVSGQTVTGIDGNVPNASTDGNVNVSTAGAVSSIVFTYGPGPNDGFGQNQRIGISNIVITGILDVPEPSTFGLIVAGLVVLIAAGRRSRATHSPAA